MSFSRREARIRFALCIRRRVNCLPWIKQYTSLYLNLMLRMNQVSLDVINREFSSGGYGEDDTMDYVQDVRVLEDQIDLINTLLYTYG